MDKQKLVFIQPDERNSYYELVSINAQVSNCFEEFEVY